MTAVAAFALGACGSDSQPNPTSPDTSGVDARQAPGPNGNNPPGETNGTQVTATTVDSTVTADTQEQIGDQSPGGNGGLPGAGVP